MQGVGLNAERRAEVRYSVVHEGCLHRCAVTLAEINTWSCALAATGHSLRSVARLLVCSDAAILNLDDAFTVLGHGGVVRHQHDREAAGMQP